MKEYRISAWIIRQRREAGKDIEMKKCRNVITCAGGGGVAQPVLLNSRKPLIVIPNCASEQRHKAKT